MTIGSNTSGNSRETGCIELFRRKMTAAGMHPLSIDIFEKYYVQLCRGDSGIIPESDLVSLENPARFEDLKQFTECGRRNLSRSVVIKLNGGLGTSMGMERPKSLLEVKNGLTFLDIITRQVLRLRDDFNAPVPLILMNSNVTYAETREYLKRYPGLPIAGIASDFIQNRVPKIMQSDLTPASYPQDPDMEWNPPGHGDIYASLMISGCLKKLLERGYRYAFISNSDNLGAELDPSILGYFISSGFSFLMEVAERTDADRKGGHLGRHRNGQLILREVAQCAEQDRIFFSDINRHRFFNTNTIWIDLEKLGEILGQTNGYLGLPLIKNRKTVNPLDPSSGPIYQMETAMGSAISIFPNAAALWVPRTRFFPVKTTDDLIGLWSDAYEISDTYHLQLAAGKRTAVISRLDERFYRMIGQLQSHFASGAPSLIQCDSWQVLGEVFFEHNIRIVGSARIENRSGSPRTIPSGSVIQGDYFLD